MMRSEILRDRLLQVIGLIVLAGLTAAFVFAFRENMLPQQEEGDVFGTVYAITSGDSTSGDITSGDSTSGDEQDEGSVSEPAESDASDLSSGEESE